MKKGDKFLFLVDTVCWHFFDKKLVAATVIFLCLQCNIENKKSKQFSGGILPGMVWLVKSILFPFKMSSKCSSP
jgi:hypothetical protein